MSVLFADIAGSTALIERLDAEQTAAVLDRPVQLMIAAVEQFDGTVSHLGDGIMAVFGAPSSAGEDHAVRACLAALRIRDGIEAAADGGIHVRIGIHTGDVMMRARRLGRATIWEPIGPALHVAARLEQTADPGTICISVPTEAQARGFIEAVPLPPVHAKGLSEPLRRWALRGMRRDRDRWSVRAARGLVGFVGRTEELAALRRVLAGPPRDRPLVVQVTGPAGIGKSRLLHEALGAVESGSALVARLAGDPHGRDAAYHAFAIWLRGWAGILPGDPADAACRALRARLDGNGADAEALERLLGLHGGATVPFGRTEGMDAAGAAAAVFLSAADGRRIVLACEDVDCFDAAGRELLLEVLDRLRGRDVLVLATSRSRHRLGREWDTKLIALDALGEDDTLALLHRVGGAALGRAELAAAIHARTGGNPLFVEEVAALAARSGGADDLPEIPDRVEALIGDRLDKLPRAQKHLLQVGAVLGGVVPLRLLARVLGEPEAALHVRLLRLQGEHVLHQLRRDPDPEFAFDHALLRDAAYQMMPASRRRELHARVVEVLEADAEGARAERLDELSHHAVRASLPEKAVRYLYEAASLDAAKWAFQLARGRLDQALRLSRALPESDAVVAQRIGLLLAQRIMLGTANDYKALLDVLDETEALAERIGDAASKVVAMVQRVHVLSILGRLQDAVALGEAAVEAARRHGDDGQVVTAAHYWAQALFNLGRLREADGVLGEAATLLERVGPGPAIGRSGTPGVLVHCTRALVLTLLGDGQGAVRMAADAQRLAEVERRPYDEAFALFATGVARLDSQPAAALDAFSRGAALCETWRIEQLAPPLQAGLGHATLRCGNAEGAVAHLEVARAGARTSGRPMMQSWAASGLALARHAQGRTGSAADEARAVADEAVALAEGSGYRGYQVIALRAKGTVFPGAAGRKALRDALALATELGMRAEAEACRAALGADAPARCGS